MPFSYKEFRLRMTMTPYSLCYNERTKDHRRVRLPKAILFLGLSELRPG